MSDESNGQADQPTEYEFSETERYWIERSLRRIRLSLRHNQVEMAKEIVESLEQYLDARILVPDSELKRPNAFSPVVAAYQELCEWVDEFWQQFESSAAGIPGGQELLVNDKPFSFVEYQDGQLIVRGQGYNLRILREHIPTELAILIAEQGAIPEIQAWRYFQVGYLATRPEGLARYRDRINGLVEASEKEGWKSDFSTFQEFDPDLDPVRLELDVPDRRQTNQFTDSVLDQWPAGRVKERTPVERFSLWMEWGVTETKGLEDEQVFQNYLMALNLALKAAMEAGEAALLEQAITEMGYLSNSDTTGLLLDRLTELAEKNLTFRQVLDLKRLSDPLLEQTADNRTLKALASRLQDRIGLLERQHNIKGAGQMFGALR